MPSRKSPPPGAPARIAKRNPYARLLATDPAYRSRQVKARKGKASYDRRRLGPVRDESLAERPTVFRTFGQGFAAR